MVNTHLVDVDSLGTFKEEYLDANFIDSSKVQSLTDAQKVQALNNIEGKSYSPLVFSGLGKKIFAKNIQRVEGI